MDTAVINDFLVGYIEGVKSVDPEIKVMSSYVGSYEDVSKCMEMTTQLYNQGAQIVYVIFSSPDSSIFADRTPDKYADWLPSYVIPIILPSVTASRSTSQSKSK